MTFNMDKVPGYRRLVDNPVGGFVDALPRGVGQVFFQNNPITGLLFLGGIFYNSVTLGLYALLGVVVSTLTAVLVGVGRDVWRAGLFGFNGTLTGIAFAFFLEPSGWVLVYAILGAAASSVIMAALTALLGPWNMPALTAPFVFATWVFLFAFFSFPVISPTEALASGALPEQVSEQGAVGAGAIFDGFFKGVGQVMFQNNVVTGVFFLAGLLVNSPIVFLFAAAASIISLLVAWVLGAPESLLSQGLFGFNAVLTGIALGGAFLVITWRVALYAILGIIGATIAFATLSNLLTPWGMPVLTSAFVFTTWLMIAAVPIFGEMHQVPAAEATTPEDNRRRFLAEKADQGP